LRSCFIFPCIRTQQIYTEYNKYQCAESFSADPNYGFKGLFPGHHDGKSFFGLDFSLHGEQGDEKKKGYRPYGLSEKQRKARYSKKHGEGLAGKPFSVDVTPSGICLRSENLPCNILYTVTFIPEKQPLPYHYPCPA
jgi:hypothetical protein